MTLSIESFECGPVATNAWLAYDPESRDAVLIDAPPESAAVIIAAAERAGVEPAALVLTHTHWDHTAAAAALKRHFPSMVIYVHPEDRYRLVNPMEHTVWPLPFTIEAVEPDATLHDGDELEIGTIAFEVIHTPGHTEGGICLYERDTGDLFAGDTIFAGSVGRTDLPGGDWPTLSRSIERRLMDLPDDVRIHPGHGPSTTVGRERVANPFVGEGGA